MDVKKRRKVRVHTIARQMPMSGSSTSKHKSEQTAQDSSHRLYDGRGGHSGASLKDEPQREGQERKVSALFTIFSKVESCVVQAWCFTGTTAITAFKAKRRGNCCYINITLISKQEKRPAMKVSIWNTTTRTTLSSCSFFCAVFKSVQFEMDDAAANESWICPHLTVSLTISNDTSLANTINSKAGENKIPPQ